MSGAPKMREYAHPSSNINTTKPSDDSASVTASEKPAGLEQLSNALVRLDLTSHSHYEHQQPKEVQEHSGPKSPVRTQVIHAPVDSTGQAEPRSKSCIMSDSRQQQGEEWSQPPFNPWPYYSPQYYYQQQQFNPQFCLPYTDQYQQQQGWHPAHAPIAGNYPPLPTTTGFQQPLSAALTPHVGLYAPSQSWLTNPSTYFSTGYNPGPIRSVPRSGVEQQNYQYVSNNFPQPPYESTLNKSAKGTKKGKKNSSVQQSSIIVPRKGSKGVPPLSVPAPSADYLSQAYAVTKRLTSSQRLLIIIDLNGTVLHRPSRKTPTHFITRPHSKKLFQYLFANHSVMVWSSAKPENVEEMCDKLFTAEQRQQLIAIWARDTLGLSEKQYNNKVQVYKRLEQIWKSTDLVGSGGTPWTQANTLLIDDSLEKGRGEPFNAFQVPEFKGVVGKRGQPEDAILKDVIEFLEEAKWWDNVSSYVRGWRTTLAIPQ